MNHYEGLTPDQRYKNELLDLQRQQVKLLSELNDNLNKLLKPEDENEPEQLELIPKEPKQRRNKNGPES
ncbi:hypothetical protein ACFQ3J_00395 [Paenibacillus provencensis]|uniref:Transposase n=1 Tax=Paenibacillus provencensis TaxID=441151 RepID=A0ABW3PKR4_9BACL|nr:hypothetical protein [Paenibacillus sp. MER 78]MCM3130947.1 hypothetical protein [Paenibacillus sp. MER 78]